MPVQALLNFLNEKKVKYVTVRHSIAYTAQEIAHSAHISGKTIAKTVMADLDGTIAMAVLRGVDKLDLDLLSGASGAKRVRLAGEDEFWGLFPKVDMGAMPPFGNLYGMDVYVDEGLREDEEIAFNAGNHSELIKLAYADFERLVQPKVVRIAMDAPVLSQ